MSGFILRFTLLLILVAVPIADCTGASRSPKSGGASSGELGVDASALSPRIDHPYVAFSLVKRAVYQGMELDDETGDTVRVRVVVNVRDTTETVAGVGVTAVEVLDYENGELVEKTIDYYAQDTSGAVYYLGERVDDLEEGKVAGHEGQWMAGVKHARAGTFMPGRPAVGDSFEQERAPGVAEDRSRVIRTGITVTVPAGTCQDCLETEDLDPVRKTSQHKWYCRGWGLVRELGKAQSLELVELELRATPPASTAK